MLSDEQTTKRASTIAALSKTIKLMSKTLAV